MRHSKNTNTPGWSRNCHCWQKFKRSALYAHTDSDGSRFGVGIRAFNARVVDRTLNGQFYTHANNQGLNLLLEQQAVIIASIDPGPHNEA